MALSIDTIYIPEYGITLNTAYAEVVQFQWQKPAFTADIMLHVWPSAEASQNPNIRPFEIFKTITFSNNFQTPLIQQMVDDVEDKIITNLGDIGSIAVKTPTLWIEAIIQQFIAQQAAAAAQNQQAGEGEA